MIAQRLIGARNAKGLTQDELAESVGVSLRTIQNWEGGNTEPNGKDLRKVAEVLGQSIPYLIGQVKQEGSVEFVNEAPPESDAQLWRRRAIDAEQTLHSLRSALRSLWEMSSTASPPPANSAGENAAAEWEEKVFSQIEGKKTAHATESTKHRAPTGAPSPIAQPGSDAPTAPPNPKVK